MINDIIDIVETTLAGRDGTDGDAATITIGTVQTGDAVSVTNSGTKNAAVLDFTLPKGVPGDRGEAATITIGGAQSGDVASVTNSGTANDAILDFVLPKGDKGDPGDDGAAATVAIGTVTTGEAGSQAVVSNSGTDTAAVLDFTLPKGDKGDKGDGLQVSHVASDVGSLPTSDVAEGTMAMVSGVLYAWDGSQWSEQGDITGGVDLSDYYTKTDADGTFATKTELAGYYDKSAADVRFAQTANVYDRTTADSTFAKKTDIVDAYTKTESDEKYATLADTYDKTTADGTFVNQSSVIDVAHGGTGASTAKGASYALLDGVGADSTAVSDATSLLARPASPTEETGGAVTHTAAQLWTYINGKIASEYPTIGQPVSAKAKTQTLTFSKSLFNDGTKRVRLSDLTLGAVNLALAVNDVDNIAVCAAAGARLIDINDDPEVPEGCVDCEVISAPTGDMRFSVVSFDAEPVGDAS